MKPGRTNFVALIFGIVLLLLPMYVGAYLVALKPGFINDNHFRDQLPPEVFFPYRWCHPNVGHIFWPLEWVDRQLRTSKWEGREIPRYIWSREPFGKDTSHPRLHASSSSRSPFDD